MGKQRIAIETAEDLEKIAVIDPETYLGYVCRGVALGLRGRLKEGLEILEQATSLVTLWSWDHYFWKGMLCAYYYPGGKYHASEEAIEKALDEGMPTILLTPLFWLEKDRPEFFEQYARQLLEKYGV